MDKSRWLSGIGRLVLVWLVAGMSYGTTPWGRAVIAGSTAASRSPGMVEASSSLSDTSGAVEGYHLISADVGWLLLDGQLHMTSDGGLTWANITPPEVGTGAARDVAFVDARMGWVVFTDAGGGGALWISRTEDGGSTWATWTLDSFVPEVVASEASGFHLQFLSPQRGWLAIKRLTSSNFSQGSLFRTDDGGQTWTRLSVPVGEVVRFVSPEVGWTAGGATGAELFRTRDGGTTWEAVRPDSVSSSPAVYQVPVFSDEYTGVLAVIAMVDGQAEVQFHTTEDGGMHWREMAQSQVQASIASVIPFSIVGTRDWFVLEPSGQRVTRFSAQGAISYAPFFPAPVHLASIDFASTEVGWALSSLNQCLRQSESASGSAVMTSGQCTQQTQLLRTEDGGRTWSPLPLPPAGSVMVSASTAFSFSSQPNASSGPSGQAAGGRTRVLIGQGFDKCEIPTLSDLQDWLAAGPYAAVNLYIGGSLRACRNASLNSTFLYQLAQAGWTFIPTWVGPQAACSSFASRMSEDPVLAYAQGVAEANAATSAAASLGLTLAGSSGTIIYYDLEGYTVGDPKCAASRTAAQAFISGWTAQLHALGNQAGVYGGAYSSALGDFAGISNVPDAIWLAAWYKTPPDTYHSDATVWLGPNSYLDDSLWANHQRIRQYAGDHNETWGSTTLRIDSNVIDGIVATLADNTPPTVRTQIYLLYPGSPFLDFQVLLNGADEQSGIAGYDLQYQVDGSGNWVDAATLQTTSTHAAYTFVSPAYGHTYSFRARARDRAGNQGFYPAEADSSHAVPAECPISKDRAEPDDQAADAWPFIIGDAPESRNFHQQNDQDWIRVTLQANTPYFLATSNIGGFADTVITLFAPDGVTVLAENDDAPGSWPASRLVWRPNATGTYYLRVRHFDPYGYGCSTAYTVSVVQAKEQFLPVIRQP